MLSVLKYFIETVFGMALFFNAILFIPQARKIYKTKSTEGLSLLTFVGFNVVQLVTTLHGCINNDLILTVGSILSLVFSGIVTIFIAVDKTNKRTSHLRSVYGNR